MKTCDCSIQKVILFKENKIKSCHGFEEKKPIQTISLNEVICLVDKEEELNIVS